MTLEDLALLSRRSRLRIVVIVVALIITVVWASAHFLQPAPSRLSCLRRGSQTACPISMRGVTSKFWRARESRSTRLVELDSGNAAYYQERYKTFASRWNAAVANWEKLGAPLKDAPVIVQHKAFTYLIAWQGLREIAALEPKPGVEPTTAHLSEVLATLQRQPAKMVLRAAYQSDRASQWIAERAKINAVTFPFTVGGTDGAKDLYGLYDDTVQRLLKAAQ